MENNLHLRMEIVLQSLFNPIQIFAEKLTRHVTQVFRIFIEIFFYILL